MMLRISSPTSVSLRAVIESDLDLFEALKTKRSSEPYKWFGFSSSNELRSRFLETGLLTPDGGILTVTIDEELVGRVEWFKSHWRWRDISVCWTIAIAILRDRRGVGAGTEAQRQLVDYLFRNTRMERIQAFTDLENAAERRALEKVGFAAEGVLRSAQWRDGWDWSVTLPQT